MSPESGNDCLGNKLLSCEMSLCFLSRGEVWMVDPRIEKLAKLCVHYSVDVKPKENVVIQGTAFAFPLMHELYRECLLSDAYPMILPSLETQFTFYKLAKEHQLTHVSYREC
jgi:leucyl aminopeptidase (aminopeptidase T)